MDTRDKNTLEWRQIDKYMADNNLLKKWLNVLKRSNCIAYCRG